MVLYSVIYNLSIISLTYLTCKATPGINLDSTKGKVWAVMLYIVLDLLVYAIGVVWYNALPDPLF